MVGQLTPFEFGQQLFRRCDVSVHVLHFVVRFLQVFGTGNQSFHRGRRVLHLKQGGNTIRLGISAVFDHILYTGLDKLIN